MIRTLHIATLALLIATPIPTQGSVRESHGISITNGYPMEWKGETLVLLWAGPGQRLVSWHDPKTTPFAIRTRLQVVGFAVYDPRPCAVGSRAWLSSHQYTRNSEQLCGLTMEIDSLGYDGFGYSWPDPQPIMENCWPLYSSAPHVEFVAHYCGTTVTDTNPPFAQPDCVSNCGPDTYPMMSFLLVRPIFG